MDFLAIGDTVVDDFIKLKDATVHCDIDNEHCTISMRWGDKIPFESSTVLYGVGNAANAAVAARRLGLSSALLSAVGDDDRGSKIIETLKAEGLDTSLIAKQKNIPTNYHYVLWYESERTILIKHGDFDYAIPSPPPTPKTVYLSSLSEHCLPLHDEIATWLEKNPRIMLAFQPGTFQIKAGLKRLERLYKRTDVFFANKEEYQRILGSAEEDVKKLLSMLHEHGPKTCILTDGPHGAYGLSPEGAWRVPMYPDPKAPLERTGAGDAFASTVVIALALKLPLSEALRWGPVNSMSVVQYVGAQRGLLSKKALEDYLAIAPPEYKVTPLD